MAIRYRRKTIQVLVLYGTVAVVGLLYKVLGYHDFWTFLDDAEFYSTDPVVLILGGLLFAGVIYFATRKRASKSRRSSAPAASEPAPKYRPAS